MIIQSAGILSPDFSTAMSPGTTSSKGISCDLLSRNIVVFNCTISNNLATASVASFSCQNPSSPLTITIEIMIIASSVWPRKNDSIEVKIKLLLSDSWIERIVMIMNLFSFLILRDFCHILIVSDSLLCKLILPLAAVAVVVLFLLLEL